jgi:hypothetical protein
VSLGKLAEESVEVEVMECGCSEVAVVAAERGKVTMVHVQHEDGWGSVLLSLKPSSSRGVSGVFVDEVGLEYVFVMERSWAEGAIEMLAVYTGKLVVVGPMDFCGDKQAIVTTEEDWVISEHKRAIACQNGSALRVSVSLWRVFRVFMAFWAAV